MQKHPRRVADHSRERDGGDGEDFENEEDDESIAVRENTAVLQHDRQYGHCDRHLSERRQKPSHPMHRVV